MTEPESELLRALITARWSLPAQVVFGIGMVAGYWLWARLFYAAVDPVLRRWVSGWLGAPVVWVLRGSRAYPDTLGRTGHRRWGWGVPAARTARNDAVAWTLSFLFVTVLAGLWPVAVFFLVALWWKALSYVVFFPTCLALVTLYGIFWAGRFPVAGTG
jgi:hypothetical protein